MRRTSSVRSSPSRVRIPSTPQIACRLFSACSAAVLVFDINYLKQTNDTQGHLAGDHLIREAADCIAACFRDGASNNCFRFGGDEFAVVVRDCTPQSLEEMIERFRETEREHNISISFGYAYTDDIRTTSVRKLLDEADRQMYADKETAHRNRG